MIDYRCIVSESLLFGNTLLASLCTYIVICGMSNINVFPVLCVTSMQVFMKLIALIRFEKPPLTSLVCLKLRQLYIQFLRLGESIHDIQQPLRFCHGQHDILQ